jgi:LysR family glycine cleavage system transcriptional activator
MPHRLQLNNRDAPNSRNCRDFYVNTLPPFPSLRSFEAVARLGSVTLAAAELHVSHSAVSQRIKVLEERLGFALFTRESRCLRLNENGSFYALQIRRALDDIAQATKLMINRL